MSLGGALLPSRIMLLMTVERAERTLVPEDD
jgi:hypothetical protein